MPDRSSLSSVTGRTSENVRFFEVKDPVAAAEQALQVEIMRIRERESSSGGDPFLSQEDEERQRFTPSLAALLSLRAPTTPVAERVMRIVNVS